MLTTPEWLDAPKGPGVYWCEGIGKATDYFDVVRVTIREDNKMYALFTGNNLMYPIENLVNVVGKWYGPVALADITNCIVMSNGLYRRGQEPQEPLKETKKRRKISKRSQK